MTEAEFGIKAELSSNQMIGVRLNPWGVRNSPEELNVLSIIDTFVVLCFFPQRELHVQALENSLKDKLMTKSTRLTHSREILNLKLTVTDGDEPSE